MKLRNGKVYKFSKNFEEWYKLVGDYIYQHLKMSITDIPDEDYWMNWHNGKTYKEMGTYVVSHYM